MSIVCKNEICDKQDTKVETSNLNTVVTFLHCSEAVQCFFGGRMWLN